jgi:hypothetical protein
MFLKVRDQFEYVPTGDSERAEKVLSRFFGKLEEAKNPFGEIVEIASYSGFLFIFFRDADIIRVKLDDSCNMEMAKYVNEQQKAQLKDIYLKKVDEKILMVGRTVYGGIPINALCGYNATFNLRKTEFPFYFPESGLEIVPLVEGRRLSGFAAISEMPMEDNMFLVSVGDFKRDLTTFLLRDVSNFSISAVDAEEDEIISRRLIARDPAAKLFDPGMHAFDVITDGFITIKLTSLDNVIVRCLATSDWNCGIGWVDLNESFYDWKGQNSY